MRRYLCQSPTLERRRERHSAAYHSADGFAEDLQLSQHLAVLNHRGAEGIRILARAWQAAQADCDRILYIRLTSEPEHRGYLGLVGPETFLKIVNGTSAERVLID